MNTNSNQVVLVENINSGRGSLSYPSNLTEFNDRLYFFARDFGSSRSLWVSDGTSEGTNIVADINLSNYDNYNLYTSNLTEYNGRLYFSTLDRENGSELWVILAKK